MSTEKSMNIMEHEPEYLQCLEKELHEPYTLVQAGEGQITTIELKRIFLRGVMLGQELRG